MNPEFKFDADGYKESPAAFETAETIVMGMTDYAVKRIKNNEMPVDIVCDIAERVSECAARYPTNKHNVEQFMVAIMAHAVYHLAILKQNTRN